MSTKVSDLWKRFTERNLTKQESVNIAPPRRRLDGGLATSGALMRGLYDGSAQELSLSSYISQAMINIPKGLVGIPVIQTNEDNKLVNELAPLLVDEFPIITATMLLQGTAWRWARWSDKPHRLVWEAIPDEAITAIIIEKDTGEITEIYSDEMLEFNKSDTVRQYTRRKRHWTKETITEELIGSVNKTTQYKNEFGFLPVPFGHDVPEGEWRGSSVFSRVIRLMKDLHDIAYQRDRILADFAPKLVQTVNQGGVKTWIENNNSGSKDGFDPYGRDFVINQSGEMTQFLALPSDATAQHTAAIEDLKLRIIAGSGLPQIFHGEAVSGNYATSDNQVVMGVEYIKSIQREMTKASLELINQSLKILGFMRFTQAPAVKLMWGHLDMMSALQKSQVLGAYAGAISSLLAGGAVSKDGALYFTKRLFPDYPAEDAEHYLEGLKEIITEHTSRIGQPAFEGADGGMF